MQEIVFASDNEIILRICVGCAPESLGVIISQCTMGKLEGPSRHLGGI